MHCFEKAAKIEMELFFTSKNISICINISQSHISKSTEMAYKRGGF